MQPSLQRMENESEPSGRAHARAQQSLLLRRRAFGWMLFACFSRHGPTTRTKGLTGFFRTSLANAGVRWPEDRVGLRSGQQIKAVLVSRSGVGLRPAGSSPLPQPHDLIQCLAPGRETLWLARGRGSRVTGLVPPLGADVSHRGVRAPWPDRLGQLLPVQGAFP